jgi:hypothetical protein
MLPGRQQIEQQDVNTGFEADNDFLGQLADVPLPILVGRRDDLDQSDDTMPGDVTDGDVPAEAGRPARLAPLGIRAYAESDVGRSFSNCHASITPRGGSR